MLLNSISSCFRAIGL